MKSDLNTNEPPSNQETSLKPKTDVENDSKVDTVNEVDFKPNNCPHCESKDIIKRGVRKTKNGNVQMFYCKDCKRKFLSEGSESDDEEVDWEDPTDDEPETIDDSGKKKVYKPSMIIQNCPKCNKPVKGLKGLASHIHATKCSIEKCPACGKKVNGIKGLAGHLKGCPELPSNKNKRSDEEVYTDKDRFRRDVDMTNTNTPTQEHKGETAATEPALRADAAKMRGKVSEFQKRVRKLPPDFQDRLRQDSEVLRDFKYDLRLKTHLTTDTLKKTEYELDDIEEAIIDMENESKNSKSAKPDDLDNGEVDYVKKMREFENQEDQAFAKQMYRKMMQAKLDNMEKNSQFALTQPLNKDNGEQSSDLVSYTTTDGDTIQLTRKEAKELELKKLTLKQQESKEQQHKDYMDPIVEYPVMEEGKYTGKIMKIRQSTADNLALLERTSPPGKDTSSSEELSTIRDFMTNEIRQIREQLTEEKVQKRLDKLEQYLASLLNRDSTEEAMEWKERLQRIGALGEDKDMSELKHIHQMEANKFTQAATMMSNSQKNMGYTLRKGVDLVEAIALDRKKTDTQQQTTEPMVDGMNEQRINYPPGGQPLPPTHDPNKTELSYQDYVADFQPVAIQRQQQPPQQPQQAMTVQNYVQEPPPQVPQQQPQQPQLQIQQPPPQPPPQIPQQQPQSLVKNTLTMKDIVPDDVIPKPIPPNQENETPAS